MAEYSKLWLELFGDDYFLGATAKSLNYLRNHRKVKLKEIAIDKRKYNYWKSEGLFEQLDMHPQNGGWLEFNSIDEIALMMVGRLWDFGISVELNKEILQFLYNDSIIVKDIELFVNDQNKKNTMTALNLEHPNLYSFLLEEKGKRKTLMNNLELIVIYISQKKNRVSLIYDTDGNLALSINKYYFDMFGNPLDELNVEGTYLSLSISEIVSSVIIKTIVSGHNQFVAMFQNATIRPDKTYQYEELPIDTNLSRAIKEHQNQDILIEIRNNKKQKIKRTIISPKKQNK